MGILFDTWQSYKFWIEHYKACGLSDQAARIEAEKMMEKACKEKNMEGKKVI